jgi:hypothetical protein
VGGRWNPRQACRAAAYARWPCRRRQRVPVARGSGPGTAFVGDFICVVERVANSRADVQEK